MIAASAAFVTGGAFMRASGGFTRPWPTVVVATMFVVGAFFLTRAVQRSGLATAYTVGLGIEAVLAVSAGVLLFGERPSPTRMIGIALIILGVAGVRLG